MDIKIVSHPSGDWEGLYIEGRLMREGHSISLEDLVNAMNQDFLSGENMLELTDRDLGNEEGFDEDYDLPLKYEDITF